MKNNKIKEEDFVKICNKKPPCFRPFLNKVLDDYANTPEYLRRYIEAKKDKEFLEFLKTIKPKNFNERNKIKNKLKELEK